MRAIDVIDGKVGLDREFPGAPPALSNRLPVAVLRLACKNNVSVHQAARSLMVPRAAFLGRTSFS
jgi:hypothetical protein